GVALLQVGPHEGTRLREDLGRERLQEHALGDLFRVCDRQATQHARGAGDEAREADVAQLEAGRGDEGAEELRRHQAPVPEAVAHERPHREAGQERPVDVEKGTDPRPGGALVDVAGEVCVGRHGPARLPGQYPISWPGNTAAWEGDFVWGRTSSTGTCSCSS